MSATKWPIKLTFGTMQEVSADTIKAAMVNLYREMDKRQLKSKLLLQVHDELVFEVPEEELEIMCRLVPQIMSAVSDNLPIIFQRR